MHYVGVVLAMLGLPEDVSRYLLGFLCLLRYDWRTCKAHEAKLIQDEVKLRSIEAYYGFWMIDYQEITTWTLFGIRYIIHAQYTVPFYEKEDYGLNYSDWYEHRLQTLQ